MLIIVLFKGWIFDDILLLFVVVGIVLLENLDKSCKLIILMFLFDVCLFIVCVIDVLIYVEYGVVDFGVVGKDVLMEYGGQGFYELLDLCIVNCKLMIVGVIGVFEFKGCLWVVIKFVNVVKCYYVEQGCQVDVIKLYGLMELVLLVGFVDKIIDVVDIGNILCVNGLEFQELIVMISLCLVVNKVSMKMQYGCIQLLIDILCDVVEV